MTTSLAKARQMPILTPLQQGQARVVTKLRADLGHGVCGLLDDPDVIEVMANPDGWVWVDRLSVGAERTDIRLPAAQIENTVCTVAAMHNGSVADAENPLIQAELRLPGQPRFQGTILPVSLPTYTIRKHTPCTITLFEQTIMGTVTPDQAQILLAALARRDNIIAVGATLAGKTVIADSLMDSLYLMFGKDTRIVTIEDTYELHCPAINKVMLHTDGAISLQSLVRAAMRMRPDRVVVGEVRGAEALDLLKAWGTGHPGGICTLHANSAAQALSRLHSLVEEAGVTNKQQMIAETIDLVVMMERPQSNQWRVKEILRVEGWNVEKQSYQFATL